MQYKTVIFDANRPAPRQITEPLDSDYGVAVKVYRNGAPVDGAISVGGTPAAEGRDGWKTCELSTGSAPCAKELGVTADAVVRTHLGVNATGEVTNPSPLPISVQTPFIVQLSDYGFEPGDVVRAEDVDLLSGWYAGQAVASNMLRVMPGEYSGGYQLSGGMWVKSGNNPESEITLSAGSTVRVLGSLAGGQSAEAKAVIETGVVKPVGQFKFKLMVQEQDLGYIDIKEQE